MGAGDPVSMRVCSVPGCPVLSPSTGRCDLHRREADQARGSSTQRGYADRAWHRARAAALRRDRTCVLCQQAPAVVADHYPDSRRDLLARGVPDPDAPHRLRGLCLPCDHRQTAQRQPGGWHAA